MRVATLLLCLTLLGCASTRPEMYKNTRVIDYDCLKACMGAKMTYPYCRKTCEYDPWK